MEAFVHRLRDEVDLEQLSRELVGVVGRSIEPAAASLWLRTPEEQRPERGGRWRRRDL